MTSDITNSQQPGYVYCMSNPSMPGLLKIGMTERTPDIRLGEANMSNTWIPTSFELELAKRVINPGQKEKTLHKLLEQYTERINPRREFFRVSIDEVKVFFDLMDGELWSGIDLAPDNSITVILDISVDDTIETGSIDPDEPTNINISKQRGCRDMTKCFRAGQLIRHVIGINKIWQGYYDAEKNVIVFNNPHINNTVEYYKSLSGFAQAHYKLENPNRISANGWIECECFDGHEWISTNNLDDLEK
jgi:hypothetical protein